MNSCEDFSQLPHHTGRLLYGTLYWGVAEKASTVEIKTPKPKVPNKRKQEAAITEENKNRGELNSNRNGSKIL